jgi:hypothetical protein
VLIDVVKAEQGGFDYLQRRRVLATVLKTEVVGVDSYFRRPLRRSPIWRVAGFGAGQAFLAVPSRVEGSAALVERDVIR